MIHLYSQMLEFNKELKSPEELAELKSYNVYRKFDKEDELNAFLSEHPLKTSEGYYTADNKILHGMQGYASVFFYEEEEVGKYMAEHEGSISGFNGSCYSNWLYFDIESKISPSDMREKSKNFFSYLNGNQIEYVCFFSGNKGMHLYIPIEYLDIPEAYKSQAHVVNKVFRKQIMRQFPELETLLDPQVYAINTVLRMPFTINPKSGLLKTLVKITEERIERVPDSLTTFQAINSLIFNPTNKDYKKHWVFDESLANTTTPTEIKFDTYFPCPYGEKACIYKLLNAKLKKGDHRHDAGLRLMSWYKNDKEFPNAFVWSFLKEWNKTLTDSLSEQELKNIYKYVDTVNYNLCKDEFINTYCSKSNNCQFWNSKSSVGKDSTILGAIAVAREDAKDTSPRFNLATIFEGMNIELRPNRGQIFEIIAGSKVGKSLIALNMALRTKMPTVIFSYEMSKLTILEQFSKNLGLNPLDPIDAKEFIEATKHIFIVDEGRTPLQHIPIEVANIERTHKVKVSFVILDYLQIVPVYDINKPGWYIDSEVKCMSVIASLLPDYVKKYKWLCILPTQPTKGVEGGGSVILTPDSGSGGKAILNMADFVMTAWRPYKNEDPRIQSDHDKVISLWVGANRHDREDVIRNYNYIGDRRLIEGIYNEDVNHKPPITAKDN